MMILSTVNASKKPIMNPANTNVTFLGSVKFVKVVFFHSFLFLAYSFGVELLNLFFPVKLFRHVTRSFFLALFA